MPDVNAAPPKTAITIQSLLNGTCGLASDRRLHEIAKMALRSSPKNFDGAKDRLFRMVRDDSDLLWELFAEWRTEAVLNALKRAGQDCFEPTEERVDINIQRAIPGKNVQPPRVLIAPREPPLPARPPRGVQAFEAAGKAAQRSLLDTFKVNSVPVGDMTPNHVRRYLKRQKLRNHWLELLVQNLPPDDLIRNWKSQEDAAVAWKESIKATSNDL